MYEEKVTFDITHSDWYTSSNNQTNIFCLSFLLGSVYSIKHHRHQGTCIPRQKQLVGDVFAKIHVFVYFCIIKVHPSLLTHRYNSFWFQDFSMLLSPSYIKLQLLCGCKSHCSCSVLVKLQSVLTLNTRERNRSRKKEAEECLEVKPGTCKDASCVLTQTPEEERKSHHHKFSIWWSVL